MSPPKKPPYFHRALPWLTIAALLLFWFLLTRFKVFPDYALPSPAAVLAALVGEARAGRLWHDITASLFRVACGFALAVALGIPFGLWLGMQSAPRAALLPLVNFFRNLSPLAWIPFAILWFQIGDKPAIFLIFLASFFPLTLATIAAVATIPAVYFRVAQNYGFGRGETLLRVALPAILPQILSALRVTAGIAWVVVVAAEMVGCQDGLGYGIYDARNGQRIDIVVGYMLIIGVLGIGIDLLLTHPARLPEVRWGYER